MAKNSHLLQSQRIQRSQIIRTPNIREISPEIRIRLVHIKRIPLRAPNLLNQTTICQANRHFGHDQLPLKDTNELSRKVPNRRANENDISNAESSTSKIFKLLDSEAISGIYPELSIRN